MSRTLVLYFFTQVIFILEVTSQGQAVKQYLLTRVGTQSQPGLTKIPPFNPINQPNIPNASPGPQYFIPGQTFATMPPTSQFLQTGPPNPPFQSSGLSSTTQFISTGPPNPAIAPITSLPCQNQGILQSALLSNSVRSMMPPSSPAPPTSPIPTPISLSEPQTSSSPVMDTHVLNNLAIALQLLIVNNILNKPLPEPKVGVASPFEALRSLVPYSSPIPEPQSQFQPYSPNEYGSISYNQFTPMPNANFLGGSSFGTSSPMLGITGFKPPTRSSLTLMSPYEALGPNSPFSDPILSSQYAPTSSKMDFQSPYAAILSDNKDLFSMTDLF